MIIIMQTPPPPAHQIFLPVVHGESQHYVCSVNLCDYVSKKSYGRWELTDEGIYNEMTTKSLITLDGAVYNKISSGESWKYPMGIEEGNNIILYIFMDNTYYFTEYERVK
jgi:hypothetical protein